MADMINDDFGWDDDGYEESVPSGYWKMRDGRLIRIKAMTNDHLRNAINLFTRNGRADEVEHLVEEQKRRDAIVLRKECELDPSFRAFEAGFKAGYTRGQWDAGEGGAWLTPPHSEQAFKEFKHEKKKKPNRRD